EDGSQIINYELLTYLVTSVHRGNRYAAIEVIKIFASAMGSMTFHPNRINWSYRSRGSVARIQKNRNKKKYTFTVNQKMPDSHAKFASEPLNCRKGAGAFQPPRNKMAAIHDTR